MGTKKFKAKVDIEEIKYILDTSSREKVVKNTEIYEIVRKIIAKAHPEVLEFGDKLWSGFYIPAKKGRRKILVPMDIRIVKKLRKFFVFVSNFGVFEIRKGKEISEEIKIIKDCLKEVLDFIRVLKRNPEIVYKKVPYHLREGKIKAKYVMKKTLPILEARKILKKLELKVKIKEISLNEYLRVAGICYKSVFGKKIKNLSYLEMYKRYADGRDCGMLEIKDPDSKKEFIKWLKTKAHCGGHPFEIIFSWFNHGILLYPPSKDRPYFVVTFGNFGLAEAYFRIVKRLIKEKISFKAPDIKEVLDYLTGELMLKVNDPYDIFKSVIVSDEDKDLIKLVEWEKLKLPKWIGNLE